MSHTNYYNNKIEHKKALKALKDCKVAEHQKISEGARYQKIDNKTFALKK